MLIGFSKSISLPTRTIGGARAPLSNGRPTIWARLAERSHQVRPPPRFRALRPEVSAAKSL